MGLLVMGGVATVYALPHVVRRVAITRIQALTDRPVSIDDVTLNLLSGRVTVRGFRLAERDGAAPFADFARLDLRLHLPSLLIGHLWIREMVLSDPIVRVVRLPGNTFNFSDLVGSSGTTRRTLDVTVDRFAIAGGTVTLEDRAVSEPRTWRSEHIAIEARNVSTRKDGGTASGTSVTAGAPVAVEVTDLRLYPIHLSATLKVEGLDLTPARVYFPPDASVVIDRGRLSTSIAVALDARDGIRADATGRLDDVALVRPGDGDPLALVPRMKGELTGFALAESGFRLDKLAVDGTVSVRDPAGKPGTRLPPSSVRASAAGLTWPARTPGRVDVAASVPGGGTLSLTGAVHPPPAATRLHLRATRLNLAPWAQFAPVAARVTGLAEVDLRMNEPLAAGIPARLDGTIAVTSLGVAGGHRRVLNAERVEASGLEVLWPTRVVVNRLIVSGPRALVERDRAGRFPVQDLVARPASTVTATTSSAVASGPSEAAARLAIELREIVVRNGVVGWRDEMVSPPARLDVTRIDASVKGAGWPAQGPLHVRLALRPPGSGRLQLVGRVALDPLTADLRVTASHADLAPYQPYLGSPARISGAADLDAVAVIDSVPERRATVRGSAGLSRVEVRDGQRTVMRLERATATGLDVDWPRRITVSRLALARPWLLVERDEKGALPLRALLPPRSGAEPAATATGVSDAEPLAITVARLAVDEGGLRVVDRAIAPAFAVDVDAARLRMEGLSTAPAKPARLDLAARVGPAAGLVVRGKVGSLTGPLQLDLNGELREFSMPRTNPYLLRHAGWTTREGRLTTKLRCRVDGDALSAKTDIRLSRLQLVRASSVDEAQTRIGLPLGLITALMKDRRGDINLSFPVGGRLSDPRFEFREAIWGALRSVAINAITLPVSWIGRVRFASDSRIESIDVDPVTFEPGTATPTAEGRGQLGRVGAFLEQLPEVKMAFTPVVSSRDVDALRRQSVEATVDRIARERRLSREAATAHLFEQRFPDRPVPDTAAAAFAAVLESEPMPTAAVRELAAHRLQVVRAGTEQAGIDPARLFLTKLVEREGPESQVDLEVLQSDVPRPSRVRDVLRRLGVPLKGSAEE